MQALRGCGARFLTFLIQDQSLAEIETRSQSGTIVLFMYLTYQTKEDSAMIRNHRPVQEAEENEITPEMTEAGGSILYSSGTVDEPLESDNLVVAEMYRAMIRASRG